MTPDNPLGMWGRSSGYYRPKAPVVGYGDNPPRWGSQTVHAVREDTVRKGTFGYRATSYCGFSVTFGKGSHDFDPDASNACKRCAASVRKAAR